MERIVFGSPTENVVRWASNVGGGGGGLGNTAARAAGGYIFGPAGVALPEIATGMKMLSNRMTVANVRKLNELVRSDSNLGRELAAALKQWQTTQEAVQAGSLRSVDAQVAANNLALQLQRAGISPAMAEPEANNE